MAAAGDLNAWGERGDWSAAIAPATATKVSLPPDTALPTAFPPPMEGTGLSGAAALNASGVYPSAGVAITPLGQVYAHPG